ncbi:MAG: preprotein translocase subunit SecE [Desulfobacteraceae bacterium]|nr:preprotein translocase subunit SecE [Desulfobacteraceae bacterium]
MGRLHQKKTDQEKREKRKKIHEEKTEAESKAVKKSYVPVKASVKTKEVDKNSFFHRSIEFVKEAKGELKRVVWPSRKQTVASTIMVIVFVTIISSFLGLADFILSGLMAFVLRS